MSLWKVRCDVQGEPPRDEGVIGDEELVGDEVSIGGE